MLYQSELTPQAAEAVDMKRISCKRGDHFRDPVPARQVTGTETCHVETNSFVQVRNIVAIAVSERLLARGATWAYRVWEVAMAESAEDREQEDPRARWRKLPPDVLSHDLVER